MNFPPEELPPSTEQPAVASAPALPAGVRLAVDVGSVRIGVAACDPDAILAFPIETIQRQQAPAAQSAAAVEDAYRAPTTDLLRLQELVQQYQPVLVYVGLPLGLQGREGPAAIQARQYGRLLAQWIAPIPVRVVDERLTTVTASAQLRQSHRKGRKQRRVIDQQAAVVILQTALDIEGSSAHAAGQSLEPGC